MRLKDIRSNGPVSFRIKFQFQSGAIKGGYNLVFGIHFLRFQFQSGAIKGVLSEVTTTRDGLSFNSNLVRLKAIPLCQADLYDDLFQFQSGAIKGGRREVLGNLVIAFQFQSGAIKGSAEIVSDFLSIKFQFQSGAIKGAECPSDQPRHRCFNSNLVRLKDDKIQGYTYSREMFQFQSGAIKGDSKGEPGTGTRMVSIPIWCD